MKKVIEQFHSKSKRLVNFFKRNPTIIALLTTGVLVGVFMPEVYAVNDLSKLQGDLSGKITAIAKMMKIVAGVIASVGFIWLVITFLRGEPNYRLGGSLVIGAAMLAGASALVKFFGGTVSF